MGYRSSRCTVPPLLKLTWIGFLLLTWSNGNTATGQTVCPKGFFECGFGKCINEVKHCDGFEDCEDGRDEKKCFCKRLQLHICPQSFECIPHVNICNGVRDCEDGTDEKNCPPTTTPTITPLTNSFSSSSVSTASPFTFGTSDQGDFFGENSFLGNSLDSNDLNYDEPWWLFPPLDRNVDQFSFFDDLHDVDFNSSTVDDDFPLFSKDYNYPLAYDSLLSSSKDKSDFDEVPSFYNDSKLPSDPFALIFDTIAASITSTSTVSSKDVRTTIHTTKPSTSTKRSTPNISEDASNFPSTPKSIRTTSSSPQSIITPFSVNLAEKDKVGPFPSNDTESINTSEIFGTGAEDDKSSKPTLGVHFVASSENMNVSLSSHTHKENENFTSELLTSQPRNLTLPESSQSDLVNTSNGLLMYSSTTMKPILTSLLIPTIPTLTTTYVATSTTEAIPKVSSPLTPKFNKTPIAPRSTTSPIIILPTELPKFTSIPTTSTIDVSYTILATADPSNVFSTRENNYNGSKYNQTTESSIFTQPPGSYTIPRTYLPWPSNRQPLYPTIKPHLARKNNPMLNCNAHGIAEPYKWKSHKRCPCKKYVTGKVCDRCVEQAFFLNKRNKHGCLKCFCMNFSRTCKSSSLRKGKIKVKNIVCETETANKTKSKLQDVSCHAPNEFLGDKILSYGSKIRFRPKGIDRRSPIHIYIKGNNKFLKHTIKSRRRRKRQTFFVRLTENKWRRKNSKKKSTRLRLMVILANLQSIVLKGKVKENFKKEIVLKQLIMGIATNDTDRNRTAVEVEECECPEGYAGTSCQRCAEGYKKVPVAPKNLDGILFACHKKDSEASSLSISEAKPKPRFLKVSLVLTTPFQINKVTYDVLLDDSQKQNYPIEFRPLPTDWTTILRPYDIDRKRHTWHRKMRLKR